MRASLRGADLVTLPAFKVKLQQAEDMAQEDEEEVEERPAKKKRKISAAKEGGGKKVKPGKEAQIQVKWVREAEVVNAKYVHPLFQCKVCDTNANIALFCVLLCSIGTGTLKVWKQVSERSSAKQRRK